MSLGQGKYDGLVQAILESEEAEGIFLLVVGGKKGGGFSIKASRKAVFSENGDALPKILRHVAAEMEKDIAKIN